MTDVAEAATLLARLLRAGDTVLVKGSRGVGLERVAQTLRAEAGGPPPGSSRSHSGTPKAGASAPDEAGAAEWVAS